MSAIFKTTLALAGLALAHGECSSDDATKTSECFSGFDVPAMSGTDTEKIVKDYCTYVQEYAGCIKGGCCDDKDLKDLVVTVEDTYKTLAGLYNVTTACDVECAGSMLGPGMAAVAAAVVALKLM